MTPLTRHATLTSSQVAQALRVVSDLMLSGMPAAAVYVADHGVTVLASEVPAARWRARGDTVAGFPLHVVAVDVFGETRTAPTTASLLTGLTVTRDADAATALARGCGR